MGLFKLLLVTVSVNMGWKRGTIFPMIYSTVAIGYACATWISAIGYACATWISAIGSTGTIEATFVVVVVTASMLGLRLWLKILQALQGSCETTYHLHDFKVLRFCFLHLQSFQLVLVFRNFLTGLLDLVFDFQNFSVCHKCFSLSFFVNPSSSDRSL